MSKFIPRKIKKACKKYRNVVSLNTKWLRYVHTQLLGRTDIYQPHMKDYEVSYSTSHGELLNEYIDVDRKTKQCYK